MPGLVGLDGQFAAQKIFMHYYHVCGLMLSSEVHDRTGERTMSCTGLNFNRTQRWTRMKRLVLSCRLQRVILRVSANTKGQRSRARSTNTRPSCAVAPRRRSTAGLTTTRRAAISGAASS
jgi:hypothetical protein